MLAGKTVLLQRGQRARKRPVWLANTVDPHLADPNRINRPMQRHFSGVRFNVCLLSLPSLRVAQCMINL